MTEAMIEEMQLYLREYLLKLVDMRRRCRQQQRQARKDGDYHKMVEATIREDTLYQVGKELGLE